MKKGLFFFLTILLHISFDTVLAQRSPFLQKIDSLYSQIRLENQIDRDLFEKAMIGFFHLKQDDLLRDTSQITIIDYRKASNEKRFFVISLVEKNLLYSTFVAHGKGSGVQFAKNFSNISGSLMSSLGFFITGEAYYGKHGYSLKLAGVEPGINDNAMKRAIVIHGAEYVSEKFISKYGRLGRSWGCPALPQDLTKSVIDKIKEGKCLFAYSADTSYLKKSRLLDIKNLSSSLVDESIQTTQSDSIE